MSSTDNINSFQQALSSDSDLNTTTAAESSLFDKDYPNETKNLVSAAVTTWCDCGVNMEGMKEMRDDFIGTVNEASSPIMYIDGGEADLPGRLFSLHSSAGFDLDNDNDEDPLPVQLSIDYFYLLPQL